MATHSIKNWENSCLENPMDGEAWWAAVHGVAQSRTRLKRLSSSSSSIAKCSILIFIFSVPASELITSPRSPGSFYWRSILRRKEKHNCFPSYHTQYPESFVFCSPKCMELPSSSSTSPSSNSATPSGCCTT